MIFIENRKKVLSRVLLTSKVALKINNNNCIYIKMNSDDISRHNVYCYNYLSVTVKLTFNRLQ